LKYIHAYMEIENFINRVRQDTLSDMITMNDLADLIPLFNENTKGAI